MTPDEVNEARDYVLDNQDAIVEQLGNGDKLANDLINAYDRWYDNQDDASTQWELVRCVEAHKEGQGQ